MTTQHNTLARRPRTFTVVTVRSPNSHPPVSHKNSSLLIVEKRNQRLIFKDPPLCLEISDSHIRSFRLKEADITVHKSREAQRHKKRPRITTSTTTTTTTSQKPKTARKPSISDTSQQAPFNTSDKIKQKINDFSLKRTLEDVSAYSRKFVHLTTDNYHFFGIPRWRKKVTPETFSSRTMSSETSTPENNAAETNPTETTPTATTDAQPVVVRVTSDHASKSKPSQQNGETHTQDGGLMVPDNSEKKRRSMETLTAKMDFEDEDDE